MFDPWLGELRLRTGHDKKNFLINRLEVAKAGKGGRGIYWEFGTSRCKLLYTEWMNNKVLLYSIGNYIQYLVINHNGKE